MPFIIDLTSFSDIETMKTERYKRINKDFLEMESKDQKEFIEKAEENRKSRLSVSWFIFKILLTENVC